MIVQATPIPASAFLERLEPDPGPEFVAVDADVWGELFCEEEEFACPIPSLLKISFHVSSHTGASIVAEMAVSLGSMMTTRD